MKPTPLNTGRFEVMPNGAILFGKNDVKSAVEWLKKQIRNLPDFYRLMNDVTDKLIDAAFEDVVK